MDYKGLLEKAYVGFESLPNCGIFFKANYVKDFPLLVCGVFRVGSKNKDKDFEDFKCNMRVIVEVYIKKWLRKNPKELDECLSMIIDFERNTDLRKAFEIVCEGESGPANVLLPVSNAKMVMRRFGNCIGIKLFSNNSSGQEHRDGTQIMRTFNTPEIIEFLQSLEFTIPLPGKSSGNVSAITNLLQVARKIKSNCKFLTWIPSETELAENLISDYKKCGHGVKAAICRGGIETAPQLFIKICHWDKSDFEKSSIKWRVANVKSLEKGMYRFSDGRDLCLCLRIEGFIPEFNPVFEAMTDASLDFKIQQEEMIKAGGTLFLELSALAVNDWD